MIRDEVRLNGNYKEVSVCNCCKKSTHFLRNCPRIHYIPDKDFLIKRNNYRKPQLRQNFQRKNKKTLNALKNNLEIEEKIISLSTELYLQYNEQIPQGESIDCFEEDKELSEPHSEQSLTVIKEIEENNAGAEQKREDVDISPKPFNSTLKSFKNTPSLTELPEINVFNEISFFKVFF